MVAHRQATLRSLVRLTLDADRLHAASGNPRQGARGGDGGLQCAQSSGQEQGLPCEDGGKLPGS